MKNYLILGLLLVGAQVMSCPFTMVNDSKRTMFVVDVQNKQAVRIKVGQSAHIDPTLHGWRKYFRHETLDIYFEHAEQKNNFKRHYRLTEKYCLAGSKENRISLSDIKRIAKKPTDRMQVQVFRSAEQK